MSSFTFIPPVVPATIPTLDQVLSAGNTSGIDIILDDASFRAIRTPTDSAIVINSQTITYTNNGQSITIQCPALVASFIQSLTQGSGSISLGAGGIPTLQQVLDAGNTSTTGMQIIGGVIQVLNGAQTELTTMSYNLFQFLNNGFNDFNIRPPAAIGGSRNAQFQDVSGTLAYLLDIPPSSQYFNQPHVRQTAGPVPTFVLGNAAGTGGTRSITLIQGTDTAFVVNIHTGLAPSAFAQLFVVTYGTPFPVTPNLVILPGSQATRALFSTGAMPSYSPLSSSNAAGLVQGNSTPLLAGTDYTFVCLVIG